MNAGNSGSLSARDHRKVAQFIEQAVGIQLPEHKRSLIEVRLRKRLKETRYTNVSDYIDYALSEEGAVTEQPRLIDAITTNKTAFFREPAHFQVLSHWIIEQQEAGQSGFKLWSAACSTGEEPYTLAMVMAELQGQSGSLNFDVLATDISETVLQKAAGATYSAESIEPIPLPLRENYLLRSLKQTPPLYRVTKELRERVRFGRFNLISGSYPSKPGFDAIFCRNVMIYFSADDRARVIRQLHAALKPGGLLFIGHSESIGPVHPGFETVAPTVYRRSDGG
ncbi:methyltransferase domain-containing protein [Marinobacterium sp. AK62]|uniref:Chemotaxis protein methyltransferase n=1 Tax=Marinobacterium alkalitolerans TaxID=1542925 RepID=A0ABS3ZBN5_9GAMM|nr:CheR family methyltransferase [Marinobacterium alkalitolerans]MBP0048449.1 methyltransferase domain-containing protein [Marinobacterium alkalitolerans]